MTKHRSFQTTQWAKVVCASDPANPHAQAALEELLHTYWFPIYAFIRQSGIYHEQAEDLTQGFFLFALEHGTLHKANPAKGRFRTFILACLKHYMSDERRRETAAKRGGAERPIAFDGMEAQLRYATEPADHRTPEHLFTQKLANQLLDQAMAELEAECSADGYADVFTAVRGNLDHDGMEDTYPEISARLHVNVNTLKSHVHRFRKRLKVILMERVAETIEDEDEVRSEMVALGESLQPDASGKRRAGQ